MSQELWLCSRDINFREWTVQDFPRNQKKFPKNPRKLKKKNQKISNNPKYPENLNKIRKIKEKEKMLQEEKNAIFLGLSFEEISLQPELSSPPLFKIQEKSART